jgi:hypothetical protein
MRFGARLVVVAMTTTLLVACTAEAAPARSPGDALTRAEAEVLADVLVRDQRAGGADFVITAPYREGVVLTLTGEVDFRGETGRARAVTSFGGTRPDDTRTVFFSDEDLWVGDLPGLPEAIAAAGRPGRAYLHRSRTAGEEDATPPLLDAVIEVLLDLSSPTADDPGSFVGAGYTWQGQRSIDSRLTSLFGLPDGRTVAVAASDDLLTQYVTPLADGSVDVTITLSDHAPRAVPDPAPEQTAEAADHPDLAAAFGV